MLLLSTASRAPAIETERRTGEEGQVGGSDARRTGNVHDHARCLDREHQPTLDRPDVSHADRGAVEWVIIAYLVVIAATLLTFGRLSDLVGRKPVWMAGLAGVTLGSICYGQRRLPASAPVTDRAHPRPFHSGPGNGEAPRRSLAA